jgi:hypothetical protein
MTCWLGDMSSVFTRRIWMFGAADQPVLMVLLARGVLGAGPVVAAVAERVAPLVLGEVAPDNGAGVLHPVLGPGVPGVNGAVERCDMHGVAVG